LLHTQNTIDSLSFICVTLHFLVPNKIENLTVKPDSSTITLNCTKPTENGSCTMLYAIDREDIADGSRKGSGVTENALCGIGSHEACETYEVSANPLNINNNTSEDEIIDVTTPADGK
jgi:hypothetical protein